MTLTRPRASQILDGSRRLDRKLDDIISPKDSAFGAAWDGVTDDTAALQAFFDHLAEYGGVGVLPTGECLLSGSIVLSSPERGFSVYGAGTETVLKFRGSTDVTVLSWIGPHDIVLEAFKIDCGHSVTGHSSHGWSFRNASRVTVRDVYVYDFRNSGGLTFVDADDTYGDCHFVNCTADGNSNGQNGFLHEGMLRSSIVNCTAMNLDMTGSPSNGLQLKNRCKHSWILGGHAKSCRAGVAMGGDGGGAGDGPYNCFVRGVTVKDCLDGGVFGKTTDCQAQYHADQTNSPAPSGSFGYALNVIASNAHLYCELTIKGVQAGRTSLRVGSDDTTIVVSHADGWGDQIALLEPGVDRLRLMVMNVSPGIASLAGEITNNSGTATNLGVYVAGSLMTAL